MVAVTLIAAQTSIFPRIKYTVFYLRDSIWIAQSWQCHYNLITFVQRLFVFIGGIIDFSLFFSPFFSFNRFISFELIACLWYVCTLYHCVCMYGYEGHCENGRVTNTITTAISYRRQAKRHTDERERTNESKKKTKLNGIREGCVKERE